MDSIAPEVARPPKAEETSDPNIHLTASSLLVAEHFAISGLLSFGF